MRWNEMKMFVIESSAENSVLMGLAGLEKSPGQVDFLAGQVILKAHSMGKGPGKLSSNWIIN